MYYLSGLNALVLFRLLFKQSNKNPVGIFHFRMSPILILAT